MKYNNLMQFRTDDKQAEYIKAQADKYMMSVASYLRISNSPENVFEEK